MDGARAVGGQRDALCKFDRGRRPGEERLRVQHALRFVAQGGEEEEHGACEVALVHIFVKVLELGTGTPLQDLVSAQTRVY